MKFFKHLASLVLILAHQPVHAVCASLVKGPIVLDVQGCSNVQPEQAFAAHEPKYNFIRDLPPPQRKAFLDSYRGLHVKGKVVRSFAVRSGLSPEQGALSGEIIRAFIPPQQSTCEAITSKRLQATMDEACCEGSGVAPCLLGTSLVLKKPSVLGSANTKAGHPDGQLTAHPVYKQARQLMSQLDYKKAVILLEKLRQEKQLDVQGELMLATAYRELDKCQAAEAVLEALYQKFVSNDYWIDDEPYLRRATVLYARCLSMMEKPGEAVLVLQGFLVEPKKYRKEITESFSHPDFGYIKTSKPYIDYRAAATKALAAPH